MCPRYLNNCKVGAKIAWHIVSGFDQGHTNSEVHLTFSDIFKAIRVWSPSTSLPIWVLPLPRKFLRHFDWKRVRQVLCRHARHQFSSCTVKVSASSSLFHQHKHPNNHQRYLTIQEDSKLLEHTPETHNYRKCYRIWPLAAKSAKTRSSG